MDSQNYDELGFKVAELIPCLDPAVSADAMKRSKKKRM